ncbi:hypothetical protein EVG20_g1646 [Dentipellis fragilis]|uniref:Uncharacterized protein n=1 Tax=Dentipellis fragilis TaxID=205917 RepID=A0A4Y9Z997_9AGAM|nr:hypothetical protein EVG20_g1646 [Dentipellis fragilis]
MSRESLVPGYRQVESFGPDEDYERTAEGDIEEEVCYVTLDLGNVEPTLVPSSSTYRLIVNSADASQKSVVHLVNTEQRVQFKEVELKPKNSTEQASVAGSRKGKGKEKAVGNGQSMSRDTQPMPLAGEAMDTSEG